MNLYGITGSSQDLNYKMARITQIYAKPWNTLKNKESIKIYEIHCLCTCTKVFNKFD